MGAGGGGVTVPQDPPPAEPGPPTHTPPTVQCGGAARATSSGRQDGGTEHEGRHTAPQPANR